MLSKNDFLKKVQANFTNNGEKAPSIQTLSDMMNTFSDTIRQVISENEQVRFGNVGTFSGIEKPATTARNPSNGETVQVPARSGYPKFKFSLTTKNDCKNGGPNNED